jgi:hypothetical protein
MDRRSKHEFAAAPPAHARSSMQKAGPRTQRNLEGDGSAEASAAGACFFADCIAPRYTTAL